MGFTKSIGVCFVRAKYFKSLQLCRTFGLSRSQFYCSKNW